MKLAILLIIISCLSIKASADHAMAFIEINASSEKKCSQVLKTRRHNINDKVIPNGEYIYRNLGISATCGILMPQQSFEKKYKICAISSYGSAFKKRMTECSFHEQYDSKNKTKKYVLMSKTKTKEDSKCTFVCTVK